MRYSPGFQRLLEYAAYDSAQRGRSSVGVDDLLLGLFREDFPLIDATLSSFKVDSMVVLDRLLKANPESGERVRPESVTLSPEALRAIAWAEREAERFGHDVVTPPHTLLGILDFHREELGRIFLRKSVYAKCEEKVLAQVRELVSWLRFGSDAPARRDLDFLDPDAVMGYEKLALPASSAAHRKAFAVRLRLLKRFRAR